MWYLIALSFAAEAEIPRELRLGLGAGLEYSSNSTRILNSSEGDDWSSFTSQGLMAATSVRFRWLKKGFTVEPTLGCAVSSGQHHTKKRSDPSKSQLLDCSAAMMLRPRLAVRETLELYGIAGLGYSGFHLSSTPPDEGADETILIRRTATLNLGISVQKWLNSDLSLSADLGSPVAAYQSDRFFQNGAKSAETNQVWSAVLAPTGRLMLHLYW